MLVNEKNDFKVRKVRNRFEVPNVFGCLIELNFLFIIYLYL